MGEQLDSLSPKELGQLEHKLESSLKNVRSRKVELHMFNFSVELHVTNCRMFFIFLKQREN